MALEGCNHCIIGTSSRCPRISEEYAIKEVATTEPPMRDMMPERRDLIVAGALSEVAKTYPDCLFQSPRQPGSDAPLQKAG